MTNKKIADFLYKIAVLLDLDNANPFEVIAYQRSSRIVDNCVYNLVDLYKKEGVKGLRKIKGIGATISQNIAEYIDKGSCSKLEKLLKKIPAVQVEASQIPGVGAQIAKKLYKALKPKSIEELTKKLKSNRYRKRLAKEHIKSRTIENILAGIQIRKRVSKRIPLGEALPVAQKTVEYLNKIEGVRKADIVGSLRRMKETVGDIDIVAGVQTLRGDSSSGSKNAAKSVIEKFIKYDDVKSVIAKGETKCSVYLKEGVRVDLEILGLENYGNLLQHFTGSKDHNVKLRSYALKKGLSLSEHGIRAVKKRRPRSRITVASGKKRSLGLIKCRDEHEVYRTVGIEYILPELREGGNEITAAADGTLPKLVETKDIKGDLQLHTVASDGNSSILEYAKEALKLGYEYIGITDHSLNMGAAGGLDAAGIKRQRREIKAINQKLKLQGKKLVVLQGIEVDIGADGSLALSEKVLKKLDFVLAAVHSGFKKGKRKNTQRYLRAIESGVVTAIAHPTTRKLGYREEIDVDWEQIFGACQKYNVFLEINAALERLDLPSRLIFQAQKYHCKFIISTDSHSINGLEQIKYGVSQARRGWLTKQDILNTIDKSRLLQRISSKGRV